MRAILLLLFLAIPASAERLALTAEPDRAYFEQHQKAVPAYTLNLVVELVDAPGMYRDPFVGDGFLFFVPNAKRVVNLEGFLNESPIALGPGISYFAGYHPKMLFFESPLTPALWDDRIFMILQLSQDPENFWLPVVFTSSPILPEPEIFSVDEPYEEPTPVSEPASWILISLGTMLLLILRPLHSRRASPSLKDLTRMIK